MINLMRLLRTNVAERIEKAAMPYLLPGWRSKGFTTGAFVDWGTDFARFFVKE